MEDNFTPIAFTATHMHGSYVLERGVKGEREILNLTCCSYSFESM